MPNVGIPIMKWENDVVITKKLRDLLLEKVQDNKLTQQEIRDVVTAWLTMIEGVPYYIVLIPTMIESILAKMNIHWEGNWDKESVEFFAFMFIAVLKALPW